MDSIHMITEINRAVEDDELNLTEWEAEFLESVQKQIGRGRPLSDKQDECLVRIWEKIQ